MTGKLRSLVERIYKLKLQRNPDLWGEIESYRAKTKSTGAKYATLHHVYNAVIKLRPRAIVECGTGLSTVVICKAIEHLKAKDPGYAPSFVSLESEEFYWKHALELLPQKYKNMVDIRLSKLAEDAYSFFRGVRYQTAVAGPFDFVFVDGPDYSTNKGGPSFCFDLVNYIASSDTPVHAVIDTRVSTVYVLQKILGVGLVKYNGLARVGFVRGATKNDLKSLTEPPSSHFCQVLFSGPLKLKFRR